MWKYIFPVILVCCLGVQGGDYFDCGRTGQNCLNKGECANNMCVCDLDYDGYNCGLEKDDIGMGRCTNDAKYCHNGGTCYDNGKSKMCFCPDNMYGLRCKKERYDVICETSSMRITVFPAGTFSGEVYMKGKKDQDECKLSYGSGNSDAQEFDVEDADCGGVTKDAKTGARSRDVIIQYNSKYITNLDTKLTVTCRPGSGTIEVTKVFTSEDADGKRQQQDIEDTMATIDSSYVTFDIRDSNDDDVSGAVPLDAPLTFVFKRKMTVRHDTTTDAGGTLGMTPNTPMDACRKKCMDTPNCKSAIHRSATLTCETYSEKLETGKLKKKFRHHYVKDCNDGTPPCQFTKLQNKAGPDVNGEKKESITTYDACEIECRDMNCKSFDFGLSGAVATCIIFMSDVESKVKSSASYTYFEKSSAALRVESCKATNGQTGDKETTLKLIEDNCPSNEAGKLINSNPVEFDDGNEQFKVQAFKFNKYDTISVTCSVRYCPEEFKSQCELSCDGAEVPGAAEDSGTTVYPGRRRRRSADISNATVSKTIYILDTKLESPRNSDSNSSEEASAMVVDVMTPTLAGVGVVLFLLLVICITILLIVVKRRSGRSSNEDTKKQII